MAFEEGRERAGPARALARLRVATDHERLAEAVCVLGGEAVTPPRLGNRPPGRAGRSDAGRDRPRPRTRVRVKPMEGEERPSTRRKAKSA